MKTYIKTNQLKLNEKMFEKKENGIKLHVIMNRTENNFRKTNTFILYWTQFSEILQLQDTWSVVSCILNVKVLTHNWTWLMIIAKY